MQVLPVQSRMARAPLGLSVKKLATAARVAPQTIVRFERGEKIRQRTIVSLRQVLEAAGVEFTNGKAGRRVNTEALCCGAGAAALEPWRGKDEQP